MSLKTAMKNKVRASKAHSLKIKQMMRKFQPKIKHVKVGDVLYFTKYSFISISMQHYSSYINHQRPLVTKKKYEDYDFCVVLEAKPDFLRIYNQRTQVIMRLDAEHHDKFMLEEEFNRVFKDEISNSIETNKSSSV